MHRSLLPAMLLLATAACDGAEPPAVPARPGPARTHFDWGLGADRVPGLTLFEGWAPLDSGDFVVNFDYTRQNVLEIGVEVVRGSGENCAIVQAVAVHGWSLARHPEHGGRVWQSQLGTLEGVFSAEISLSAPAPGCRVRIFSGNQGRRGALDADWESGTDRAHGVVLARTMVPFPGELTTALPLAFRQTLKEIRVELAAPESPCQAEPTSVTAGGVALERRHTERGDLWATPRAEPLPGIDSLAFTFGPRGGDGAFSPVPCQMIVRGPAPAPASR